MATSRAPRRASNTKNSEPKKPASSEPVAIGPILAAIADIAQSGSEFGPSAARLCTELLATGATHIAMFRRVLESGHVDGAVSAGLNRHDLLAVHAAIDGAIATIEPRKPAAIGSTYIPGVGHFQVHFCVLDTDLESVTGLVALIADGAESFSASSFAEASLAAAMMFRQIVAMESQQHQVRERSTIARLTRSVVTMQGLEPVFAEVVNSVRAMTGWDSCAIGVLRNHQDTLDIESQSDQTGTDVINPWGARIDMLKWNGLRFACENCVPYRMAVDLPDSLTQFEAGEMTRLGLHSILAVPFVLDSEPVGLILVASESARRLDPAVMRTIEELGTTTALAVQHHRFVEQARLQAEEQTALIRVSQAVISGRDLSVILTEITRVCLQFDGVEGARVLLWQKDHDQFEVAAVQHLRDWQMYYRRGDRYPAADWPSVKAVLQSRTARGLLTTDSEVNARERYNHAADHIQSFH
ncbi:MAG TPA: GAF domain-containing protein, partial [Thermomicrobiales bacterium]|nr:GAF domain-containing protein [Thermomicrobiales bacterium]